VRFKITASADQQVIVEAVDWMMAMVRASELMGARVAGFSCNTRPDGIVDVTDHETGLSWVITPLDVEPAAELRATPGILARTPTGTPNRPRYRAPMRKPLWSPGSVPRKGPRSTATEESPPPNLAERLFELSLQIRKRNDAAEACDHLLELVMGLVPAEAGSVLLSRGRGELEFKSAAGPAAAELLGRRMPSTAGIAGAALSSGVTVQVNDASADPRHHSEIDQDTGFSTRCIVATPLRTETEVFGVVEVLNPMRGGVFLAWHTDVLESLGQALAHRLEELLKR